MDLSIVLALCIPGNGLVFLGVCYVFLRHQRQVSTVGGQNLDILRMQVEEAVKDKAARRPTPKNLEQVMS